MPINEGELKEREVIYDLDNHYVRDLSNNMRFLLRALFGVIDDNKLVKCYKVDDVCKTDFVIEYDDRKRNVSMKSGKAVIVHNEILSCFLSFLKEKGISDRTLETIALFQYGDGTTDGSGNNERHSYDDLQSSLQERIREANIELNKDMDFILEVLDRCVFKGSHKEYLEADCVYFGDRNYGNVATKNQFFKNTRRRGFDFYNHLHIGPILLRPHSRYINKDITYQKNRDRIVCYWPNLREDIEFMSKRFNY
ncbi:MAG: hypothetical protein K6F07_00085 [Bacilli bacterium]|nr:hypothetical protein [Bacilli bacterium]